MRSAVNLSHLGTDDWSHGMVTGNGRQGALCYGRPAALRVTLSHERLFLPVQEPLPPPDTASILPHLRALCHAGRFQDAADAVLARAVAEDPRYRDLREADPFIGAATLTFTPTHRTGAPRGWRRLVDHASGVVTQQWCDDGGGVRHETFVSRPDDVVVIRLAGDTPLSGRLHWGPITGAPPAPIALTTDHRVRTVRADFSLRAGFPRAWPGAIGGYRVTGLAAVAGGGLQARRGGCLDVVGVHRLILLVRTTVDPAPVGDLPEPDFEALLRAHRPAHHDLFDRCRLTLAPAAPDIPTEDLLGHGSAALVERLFDAGRYAIICSTGDRPPTLQGVWSGTFRPPWRGGYTMDGNLAAALAGVCATGTPELLLPLFDLLDEFRADFEGNAQRLYGVTGPLLPPHLTTHGRHNHFTSRWCLTFWTAGAAWMGRLYHEYWRYTGDRDFLVDRALPFLRAAAEFYLAFVERRDGAMTFVPSYSPENSPVDGGDGPQATINATMDVAAVRGLLRDLALPDDGLPAYRVAADGSLAEWLGPGPDTNHAHRHASHLYGLWYEADPALLDDPTLRQAATVSVQKRLAWWRDNGDEMAFGLAQVGLAAAALGLAAEAYEVVTHLATRYWRPNLVSTHNADALFNTDICGAFPALVVAMLAQSRGTEIRLLPALPAAWPRGRVTGIRLRDGVRVEELAWSPERVEARLTGPDRDHTVVVGAAGPVTVRLAPEPPVPLAFPWAPTT